jgi:hypothetical protein
MQMEEENAAEMGARGKNMQAIDKGIPEKN